MNVSTPKQNNCKLINPWKKKQYLNKFNAFRVLHDFDRNRLHLVHSNDEIAKQNIVYDAN